MKVEQTAQVGADGVLTVAVALGVTNAHKLVRVVVETADPLVPATTLMTGREARMKFIEDTEGQWQGAFAIAMIEKLKRILTEEFPPPDKLNLRDENGIIGIIRRYQ